MVCCLCSNLLFANSAAYQTDFSNTEVNDLLEQNESEQLLLLDPIKLTLFPNPASSYIQIRLEMPSENVSTLSLVDMNGKVLKQKTWRLIQGPNATKIQIDRCPAGRYEIILWMEGEAYSKSFIKH